MYHRGLSWNFQEILGQGLIPGGKEKDRARQALFLTPTNHFGDDPEEEEPRDDDSSTESSACYEMEV